jgi:hypothetical protein
VTSDSKGQPSDSPTDTGAKTPGTPQPDGDKVTVDDKSPEKPLPYDQDPKWKKARAAEARLESILKEHNFLDVEELTDALKNGMTLKQAIGDKDAKKLLEDSEWRQKVETYWDTEKAKQRTSGETPDQTIERLQRENGELRKGWETDKSNFEELRSSERAIKDYEGEATKVMDIMTAETPLADSERSLLSKMLGIDNPAVTVDISDRAAVRRAAQESVTQFQTILKTIKQQAIDEYVAGKSKLAATSQRATATSEVQSVERKPLPKDSTPDQAFSGAKNELYEIIAKGLAAAH